MQEGEKLMNEEELERMRKIIKLTLIKIGVRCDLIGFSYLCYGIELVVQNPKLINRLCKELYVKISEKFNVKNVYCIERSMRHAINKVCENNGFEELNKMFKSRLYGENEKPTSGELIRLMSEYYVLGLYENDLSITESA